MTRKDYKAIAAVIARFPDRANRESLAMAFCPILRADNPAFREGLFLAACNAAPVTILERDKDGFTATL